MVSGAKRETRLRIDDSPTSSYMLLRMVAIIVADMLNINTQIRVRKRNCPSENRCLARGLIKFSERMDAGARIAELVVLMMADKSDPKNKI